MFAGVTPRLVDRRLVEIVSDEIALGIGLSHQQRRKSDTATDICNPRASVQLGLHPVERGNPGLNDIVDIARTEKGAGGAEQAAGMAAVGYGETPVLRKLNLRLDPDDRIALLGRNGNGKTTLARLLAAQLAPMEGAMNATGKMKVGYFTQYQVEELDTGDTPLQHMLRRRVYQRP